MTVGQAIYRIVCRCSLLRLQRVRLARPTMPDLLGKESASPVVSAPGGVEKEAVRLAGAGQPQETQRTPSPELARQ
jgi:hypothetical protein